MDYQSKSSQKIREEVARIKKKYLPMSVSDLEIIAKEEYGVKQVIRTPLVETSETVDSEDGFYIFYNAYYKPFTELALSHEIGHIACRHFIVNLDVLTEETQSDYFPILLNDRTKEEFQKMFTINILYGFIDTLKFWSQSTKETENEIRKIKDLGAYMAFLKCKSKKI